MHPKLTKYLVSILASILVCSQTLAQPNSSHNLKFDNLPSGWDEGIPLGNGMLGALVWQKDGKLRISIDKADLWDLRPTKEIEKYTYKWAYEHRLSGDWDTVWKVADEPYDRDATPTKIPGAAIEFDISKLGRVSSVILNISSAICCIQWENGVSMKILIDAAGNTGRYQWLGTKIAPILVAPSYISTNSGQQGNEVVDGQDLRRLGYSKGSILSKKNLIVYKQTCWGPLKYQVAIAWKHLVDKSEGVFTISSHYNNKPKSKTASSIVKDAIRQGFDDGIALHKQWWKQYWAKSSISLPDSQLEKQWYLEMYKFGAASRKGSPPISLQAIWTADNGKLPPWKGDFHNDLNTQLSYWPAYSSNHLEEGSVYTDWLWENKPYFEEYTERVFGTDGLNVPGVATLFGHEMGGWHMYAMSPTVSCWLAQHFYLQWRYSMDKDFLNERAYPWLKGVATYLEQITRLKNGIRTLPMGSSPEFHDGGKTAWFLEMTNYDLELCRFTFIKAAELAKEVGNNSEALHWNEVASQLPDFDIDPLEGLTIAPGFPYHESHRHFSHLMALYPLGLLRMDAEPDRQIMLNSVANLEKQGTDWWCGYSFSWLGNIYARMKMGDQAAKTLRIFSSCFCSPNSFHLNGDQCKAGNSQMTYNPFTLEGNFAFASGIQEMLLQSHAGYIEVFPAVPSNWKNISFSSLRAEGAFLVSARKENGIPARLRIESEKGGTSTVKLPFRTYVIKSKSGSEIKSSKPELLTIEFSKGGYIEIENGYE